MADYHQFLVNFIPGLQGEPMGILLLGCNKSEIQFVDPVNGFNNRRIVRLILLK